jgi:DNA-binding MarR family transcriptional regulator
MGVEETFLKSKNVLFFLALDKEVTVRAAARSGGLTPQHGVRLIRKWRQQGLVTKSAAINKKKYFYTAEGASVASGLSDMLEVLNGI